MITTIVEDDDETNNKSPLLQSYNNDINNQNNQNNQNCINKSNEPIVYGNTSRKNSQSGHDSNEAIPINNSDYGGGDTENIRSSMTNSYYYDSGDEDDGGGGNNINSNRHSKPSTPSPRDHYRTPALPFTFHRAASVVVLVLVYLMLITCYYIEFRFVQQSSLAYYLFLITRPLPMVPLLLILPLYGVNDSKTIRYSYFIGLGLLANLISECLYSVNISIDTGSNTDTDTINGPQIVYYISFTFLLLSRLFYTIAFIVGIGKTIKIRLFHAIPFYAYSATLVLMIIFSSTIAPIIIPPKIQGDRHGLFKSVGDTSFINNNNNNNTLSSSSYLSSTYLSNFLNLQISPNNVQADDQLTTVDRNGGSYSYIQTSSDSTDFYGLDAPHFSLIVIYAIVEATAIWRALALTSSFPGNNPTRILLWLSVLGTTMFGITDTLVIINNYYYPLTDSIFYYSSGGLWLGNALIVFSIPRRMEVRDYFYKYINPFRANPKVILSNSDLSASLSASPIFSLSQRY